MNLARIGRAFFRVRGYMGVPIFLLAIVFADRRHCMLAPGLLFVILGEALRIWSVSFSGLTTRSRQITAPKLTTKGPYSVTRNPIYIGNFLIGFGVVLFSGALYPYLLLAYTVLFWLEYIPIIHAEEEYLSSKFGQEFEAYRSRVPRIIPDLRLFRVEDALNGDFKAALYSEKSTFIVILGTLLAIIIKLIIF